MGYTCGYGSAIVAGMDAQQNGNIGVCLAIHGKRQTSQLPPTLQIRLPLDVSTHPHIWLESTGAMCRGWEEKGYTHEKKNAATVTYNASHFYAL